MQSREAGGHGSGYNVALIHDQLRAAILRGDISAGEIHSQTQLAERLGVGRTPLREALRLLQQEGLIYSEPHRRVRIAEFSIADVEDLYIVRLALENVAAKITLPGLQPEDIAEMEGLLAQMDHYAEAGDFDRLEVPHRAFHARLVSHGGARMTRLIAEASDHADRYRRQYRRVLPGMWPTQRADHRAMLDAAAHHDADAGAAAMTTHYSRTALDLIAHFDSDYQPVRLQSAIRAAGGEPAQRAVSA